MCTQPYQQMHIDFDSQTLFVKLYVNAYTKGHVSSESRNVWDRVRMTENKKMGDESLYVLSFLLFFLFCCDIKT